MASRALLVAAIAGVLLVVSIGVDAAMNRSWTLDVQTPEGWRTLGTQGVSGGPRGAEPLTPLAVERNGTIHLRVTVDNGYVWTYDETYKAFVNGAEVARGTLHAPARSSGTAEFDVPARLAFTDASAPKGPAPGGLSLEVHAGSAALYGFLSVQEASG